MTLPEGMRTLSKAHAPPIDHGRGAEDAGEQAERVQRVDSLRPALERT